MTRVVGSIRQPTRIRRRLVLWMLVAVGVAVLLLGLPLAFVVRQWVYSQALTQTTENARRVVTVLESELGNPGFPEIVPVAARALDARVTVLDRDGVAVIDSGEAPRGAVFDDAAVMAARGGQTHGHEVGRDQLVVAVRTQLGGAPVILRIAQPSAPIVARVNTALIAISGVAAAALAVGAVLASWRARQLAEPLEALALSAGRLGEGEFGTRAPRSGIAEIDRIAAALDSTAERLRDALRRSASFSADASHQLRTPLTALRLNLDALAAELDEPSPSLEAAEAEIDRLETTIRELLELADGLAQADRVDLRALTLARLDAWRTLADAAGRAVRVTRDPVPEVRARAGAVGQALQVLLDNALVHGTGDVMVWLESVTRGNRRWVRLCVGDDGRGVQPEHLTSGAGRGLPLARSLVEAEGGRLVVDTEHGRVCLLLPAADGRRPTVPRAAPATDVEPRSASTADTDAEPRSASTTATDAEPRSASTADTDARAATDGADVQKDQTAPQTGS